MNLNDLKHSILGNDVNQFAGEPADIDTIKPFWPADASDLWWIDLETTGLDPRSGRILEVGLCPTTASLQRIGLLHSYIGPMPSKEEIAGWPEPVRRMHVGLVQDMMESELSTLEETDEFLEKFIILHMPDGKEQITLAGSSVHFDKSWLEVHLPKTADLCNYRLADISAVRTFLDRWAPFFPDAVEALKPMKQHRVIPDIEDSLVLARFIRMLVRNGVQELMPQGYEILVEGVTD